jgi:protein-disulfide isomerase
VKSRSLILFLLGSGTFLFGGTDNLNQGGNAVVAEVDGTKITLADFERRRPEALFQARNAFYESEKKAVEEFIDSYLLERRAQKENLTVAQLLERHVTSTIAKDPDDTALRVYYEGIDTNEPFEAVRDRILEILRQRRVTKARSSYMLALRNEAKITIAVAPPRVQMSLTNASVRGAADAPLTLVEFADYECPYCQQMQPALSKLEAEYKGKLAFAYKDVPLPMHAHAQKAAEAAHCAGVQNKYWEYHDLLLKTKALELPQLKSLAGDLALDTKAFDKCLDSGEQLETVRASMDEAQRLGLQGTPSFFLNGRFFSGILTYSQLREIVEEELKRTIVQPQHTAER